MNVVCVVIGSGCLQISYAFSKTGWIGVLFIVLSAAISMYTGHLSIKSLYHKPGHRLYSASDTARAAYGRIGQFVMEFFSYLYTLGTACLYMILAGQFLKQLVEDHTSIDKRVWIVILAVVMWVPVALFKFLTEATILALFGFLTSCVVILVGTIQSLRFPEYPHFHDSAIGSGVPVALSSILFSFAGSVIYPHVEASMKKPRRWPLVIMCAMTICGTAYLLIGCAGYWAYGRNVQSPLLDSIPHDNANKATVGLVMIHVIMAGPILMFSFFVEIEKKYRIQASHMGKKKELIVRIAYRTITVAVVCAVAVALPFFSSILSLIGALSCGMILAVLPVVVYLKLYGWRSVPWYELIWMFVVVAIGLIACVWGSIDAIQSLIKDVNNQ
ncbi:hypothetical protein DL89DRAFT_220841 [Linderina pennispora]|uniref:Amino acid transporter transmembrane domain-containing protein n=1 Tax=Linderina pennispora TaxID=61395 RepID=A0A1Y1WI87_9FUNG|nr:uncharacterized protein DL89DRAFT_220841 [Linderina pennispora]ORX73038.1 hypothetical protein DL89DRAFT_220841 [Linderina pennispora]